MPDLTPTSPTPNPMNTPDPSGNPLGGPPAIPQGQAPLNTRPAPTAPAPQAPPSPEDKHSHFLGTAFKHVVNALEGRQTVYTPDPETGGITESTVPRKPGGLFRDILAGALVGGAAGANAPPGSGALGGFATGGAAALNTGQAADSRRKNRAQEQAVAQKNAGDQKQAQKSADDVAQASIAKNFLSSLDLGHNVGNHNDKELDSHNNAVEIIKGEALKNGGQMAQVDGNGQPGNGPALMQKFNQDPQSVMQAPEGFHRIPNISYDTTGLVHKDGQWVDPKTGKPPDWNERATVSLIDLPNSAWNKNITTTRKTVNDVAGRELTQGKPDETVQTSFGSLFGLGMKNIDQLNSDRRDLYRGPKTENEAKGWAAQVEDIRGRLKTDPNSVTDEEKRFEQIKGPMVDKYDFKKSTSATDIKQQTEALNKKLANYATSGKPEDNLTPDERATLVQRQKSDAVKGVPADIVAAIGARPVPAQFDKGEEDPAYKAASKLWGQASLDKKAALAAAAGLARYQMLGDIRDYNVTNTSDEPINYLSSDGKTQTLQPGEMGRVTANQVRNLPPSVILNTQDGTKIMSKGAAIRDIQTNVDNLREKFSALDNLDAATRAKLIVALRDPNPDSAFHDFTVSEAKALTDPKVQDLMIAMQQMAENVMLARSVQGIGGGGSDLMRRALMNLVPNATTPTKEYAGKQLDAFQRTMNQLKTGVPTTGGGREKLEPVGGGRHGETQNAPPIKLLKEGVHTTFGNGQTWTLQGGQPVQVPATK